MGKRSVLAKGLFSSSLFSEKILLIQSVKGVSPAFVMRAHYVRLRIITIHCDFSSESYVIPCLYSLKFTNAYSVTT